MAQRLLTRREQIAARAVTGPTAHFVAGAADWLALALHVARSRLAGRDPWS